MPRQVHTITCFKKLVSKCGSLRYLFCIAIGSWAAVTTDGPLNLCHTFKEVI